MADERGVVIENIRELIAPGQEVYDCDGDRVGFVDQFDLDAGWMKVGGGGLAPKDLYIPFSAITGIDPREIYLSLSEDTLQHDYAGPPPRTTVVEGDDVAFTTEPSGYDGLPVVVDSAPIDELRNRIELGMRVHAADGTPVGTVKRYNPATGWMLVEAVMVTDRGFRVPLKDVFTHRDLRVPVTVVESVDVDAREIYLAVHRDDLQRMQQAEPAGVQFDDKVHETR